MLDAGIPLGLSSDIPYGPSDPWLAVSTARSRRTSNDRVVNPVERMTVSNGLARYLTRADNPGDRTRRVDVGSPADLCLLATPLRHSLRDPASTVVRLTIVAGKIVHTTE